MALFTVPAGAAQAGGLLTGLGPAEDGYYKVTITEIAQATGGNFRIGSFFVNLAFEDGTQARTVISVAHDANGQQLPGLTDDKANKRVKFINGLMTSLGYTLDQLTAGGYDDSWLVGKIGYVAWIAAEKGTTGVFGEVQSWITEDTYNSMKASGAKPSRQSNGSAGRATNVNTNPTQTAASATGAPPPPAQASATVAPAPPSPAQAAVA